MSPRGAELTALLISPNRDLAAQFTRTLALTRAFQIVADLKSYPTLQTLDMRIKQLRPDVVLLELTSGLDVAVELIRFLTSQNPPLHVIALHTHSESEAILKSLRMGASEFLYAPFEISIQEAAISRIQGMIVPAQPSEKELGKVVVFASAKPGSGASTLAAQTAFSIRRASGKRVLLADLDLMNGSLGFSLRLRHEHSVMDLLQLADRMNRSLWTEAVANIDGLDVLPAPDLPCTGAVEPARLHDVLQYSRMLYDWVIVDLPSIFNRVSLLAFTESDRAFLVSTSELASLHLARKAVKLLRQLGFSSNRFQVLINRVDKRDGLNASDFTKLFDGKVDTSFPNDYFSVNRLAAFGEPLEPDSELGRAVDGLANKIAGAVPEKKKTTGSLAPKPVLSQT